MGGGGGDRTTTTATTSTRGSPSRQKRDKLALELGREVGYVRTRVLSDHEHLAQVRLGLRVALEPVLVAALFLADLAVPPQALQALGLHLIRHKLRCSNFVGVETRHQSAFGLCYGYSSDT